MERERADELRVPERELLGDDASHRGPDHVRSLDSEEPQEAGGDVREKLRGVRPGGTRRPADARVVEHDDPVPLPEGLGLEQPGGVIGREAV